MVRAVEDLGGLIAALKRTAPCFMRQAEGAA